MSSNIAGPGSVEELGIAPTPLLAGATEYEVVTVLNPLPVDFIGVVGQSKPVNMPFQVRKDGVTQTISNDEQAVRANYGLNLKNPDHQARLPIANKVNIPAGETRNLLGNEAQVIVRQLVTEILQRQGKRLMLADPFQRHEVEKQVVRSRRGVEEVLGTPQTVQSQLREGVEKLNAPDEREFPSLQPQGAAEEAGTTDRSSEAGTVGLPSGPKPRKARTA